MPAVPGLPAIFVFSDSDEPPWGLRGDVEGKGKLSNHILLTAGAGAPRRIHDAPHDTPKAANYLPAVRRDNSTLLLSAA